MGHPYGSWSVHGTAGDLICADAALRYSVLAGILQSPHEAYQIPAQARCGTHRPNAYTDCENGSAQLSKTAWRLGRGRTSDSASM